MKILLVNPWITDFAAYDFWVKPLGLLYAGSFLKNRGHEIELIDCMDRFQSGLPEPTFHKDNTGKFHREIIEKPQCLKNIPRYYCRYGIPESLFKKKLKEISKPDAVLVTSVMTYWYPGVFQAISLIHENMPGVPVFLGGIYASLCTEHARKHSGADVVTVASSPSEIIELVEGETGKKGENEIISDSFDNWPEPVWNLYSTLKTASVLTTHGCPLRCSVCASHILFDGFESRSPEQSAHEITSLSKMGARDISFCDDALLIGAEKHAIPFFEILASFGNKTSLHTPNGLHVREITPELSVLMKAAGVKTVRLSLETSSGGRQADFSDKVTCDEFRSAAESLISAGFDKNDLGAYIMVGLPGQDLAEVYESIRVAWDSGVPVKPALFSPVPGTDEFLRAVDTGLISLDSDPLLHNNTLRTIDYFNRGMEGYKDFKDIIENGNHKVLKY